jgi:acyl-coenzyme A synthetase/AMP-(fatty) acid ligase
MWLTQLLDRNRRCFGDRTAIIDQHRTLTWRELDERVRAVAGGLLRVGLRQGDRVAVVTADRVEAIEVYFALAHLGAAFVPVDPGLPAEAAVGIARQVRVAAVIVADDAAARDYAFDVPVVLSLASVADLALPPYDGPLPDVRPDDVLAIVRTSATTGPAKGVVWDSRGLMQVCLGWLAVAEPTDDMTFVNCAPLCHGSLAMSFAYLAAGARLVLVPDPSPEDVLLAIRRHRATHLWVVPELLRKLVAAARGTTPTTTTLREIGYGAAPLPWPVYRDAVRTFGCAFRQAYGATEAGGHFAMLGPREHPSATDRPATRVAISAGRPLPGVTVAIRSAAGTELPVGETGEVQVRSDSLMRGYWDDPHATAEATRDGWLRTGDLGSLDEHGYLWLSGRLADLISTDGQRTNLAEIEHVLRSHAGVVDSAVVGRPDPARGAVPVAYVVARAPEPPTGAELARLLATELAGHQQPAAITFVDDLPRSAAGKVVKHVLLDPAPDHR